MRILVVSDTHGSPELLKAAVKHAKHTDMLLHLGDGVRDCYAVQDTYPGEIWKVKGNCDFSAIDVLEHFIPLNGANIFITHGHLYDVKTTLHKLLIKGSEVGADIVCFGHTHYPHLEKQGSMTLLNPGSLRYSKTYGLIEIAQGRVDVNVIDAMKWK